MRAATNCVRVVVARRPTFFTFREQAASPNSRKGFSDLNSINLPLEKPK